MGTLINFVYQQLFRFFMAFVERDLIPDFVVRRGIRLMLSLRIASEQKGGEQGMQERLQRFVEELKTMPVAIQTQAANEQHYEVPTDYFLLVLGKHKKYSSCLWPDSSLTLDEAEAAMLELCCRRAQLADGQDILELGCGWGSMCLYAAAKYPGSQVTAVSNSKTQKKFIDEQCKQRGIKNLMVITEDVVKFKPTKKWDRVVSIEMFEHMKNYQELLRRVSTWLRRDGKLFVHIFCHKRFAYHFTELNVDDWMARYFFSGGTMPSKDLLLYFQDHMSLERHWFLNGQNYSRTLEIWLKRQDRHRKQILPIMEKTYGKSNGLKWFVRWRLFYLACSELFNYNHGNEWGVCHYVFTVKGDADKNGTDSHGNAAATGNMATANGMPIADLTAGVTS